MSWDRKTTVTFSAPVEIPGVHLKGYSILPAGTYVFKLVNTTADRHIVQISNADESMVFATIMAIPNSRVQRTDKTVITFSERPAGQPPALRAWFYPDAAWGEEFVYPKSKAKELAQSNNTPVLYTSVDTPDEVTEPIQPPTQPAVAAMNAAPVMAYNPAGEEMQLSQAVTPPPPPNMQTSDTSSATPAPAQDPMPAQSTQLPQTASQLGLMMLTGLLALAGALSVRLIRVR